MQSFIFSFFSSAPSMSNGKVKHAWTNLEDDAEGLRREFDDFMNKMMGALSQQQNQEELSIIQ